MTDEDDDSLLESLHQSFPLSGAQLWRIFERSPDDFQDLRSKFLQARPSSASKSQEKGESTGSPHLYCKPFIALHKLKGSAEISGKPNHRSECLFKSTGQM